MKNQIRILTAVHGRQELVAGFFWQLRYVREATGLALPVSVAVSTQDDFHFVTEPKNKFLTEACNVVKVPNEPLTEKHNAGLRAAINEKDWDYLLQLGSDDLVSEDYVSLLSNLEMRSDCVYGVNNMYFYNLHTLKMQEFTYAKDIVLGAGRVIPRALLERCKGKKVRFRRPYYGHLPNDEEYYVGERLSQILDRNIGVLVSGAKSKLILWSNRANRGLDRESAKTLEAAGMVKQISLDEHFTQPQIIDCKTRESLTPWSRITGREMHIDEINEALSRIAPNISFE